MTCKHRYSLALGLGLLAAGALHAADTSRPAPRASSAERSSIAAADAAHQIRMSKLIGMDVSSRNGKSVGEVKDVIVDTNSGRVHYVVLSMGGVLGVGDKLYAVPLSQLRADGKRKLVLAMDKEALESAPAFQGNRWPDWRTDPYRAEVDRRYRSAAVGAHAQLRRASEVLKAEVRDANGADIGDIKDMVVDLANGRVHYVVVEFERAWSPNDKLVAVPMNALSDGATAPPPQPNRDAASPPSNPPGFLSLENPSGPSKGTASAADPPGGVASQPKAMTPGQGAGQVDRPPLPTTRSYADDDDLVYKGTREDLRRAPAFDRKNFPE